MFSKLTAQGRIWILLIAWILFAGLSVADTFDLSDDNVLPTPGQLAVALDSTEEQKPHVFVLDVFLYRGDVKLLSGRLGGDRSTLFSSPFLRSDAPLYKRHSVYRI